MTELRRLGKAAVTGVGPTTKLRSVDSLQSIFDAKGFMSLDASHRNLTCTDCSVLCSGDIVTIDGDTGNIYRGQLAMRLPPIDRDQTTILSWCDKYKAMNTLGEVHCDGDFARCIQNGADGIGILETEYMFQFPDDEMSFERVLLSESVIERQELLSTMIPKHIVHFNKAFKLMNARPVCVRLLYPPLCSFVRSSQDRSRVLSSMTEDPDAIEKLSRNHSFPNLKHLLGVRNCIQIPEITEMQVKAVIGKRCV